MRKTHVLAAVAAALALAVSGAHPAAAGMMWSSFVGGSGTDRISGVTTDAAGNIYVVGTTTSTNFPTTVGGFRSLSTGYSDVVVAKFNSTGTVLQWVARLGGNSVDDGRAIALDAAGNVFVTGSTASTDFTVTPGAFRTRHAGYYDAFVTKLTPSGGLLFSTFIGGYGQEWPMALKVDASGNPVVAGMTDSYNLPTTPGVVKPTRAQSFLDASDGFVTKLDASGSRLVYSTYLGGSYSSDAVTGLALDSSGQPIVTGWTTSKDFPTTPGAYDRTPYYIQDGFVSRLNASATGYVFSTLLGGASAEEPRAVGVDAAGNVYVTGFTASPNFPVTPGAPQSSLGGRWDGFLAEFAPLGNFLVHSTFFGGAGDDRPSGLSVSPGGDVYITGSTSSANFPVSAGASEPALNGGTDAFVAHFSPAGRLVYSSYFGSSGTDGGAGVAMQPAGLAVVVGGTSGGTFPSTPGTVDNTQNSPGAMDGFLSCWNLGTGALAVSNGGGQVESTVASESVAGGVQILSAPQPNPFQDQTTIRLSLGAPTRVTLRVRDIQGRLVRQLADETVAPGPRSWTWDGRSDGGENAAPGVYFVEIAAGGASASRRVTRLQ